MIRNSEDSSFSITLLPKYGSCYEFQTDFEQQRKSIWLVPHVIKHKDDSQIITWRCNWGVICESDCVYAMSKEKNQTLSLASAVNIDS